MKKSERYLEIKARRRHSAGLVVAASYRNNRHTTTKEFYDLLNALPESCGDRLWVQENDEAARA